MDEERAAAVELDPVLLAISGRGWSERLAMQFERAYWRQIRWMIIVQMARLGVLQDRVSPERVHRMPSTQFDLFHNVESDLKAELLKGLVRKYVEGVRAGRVNCQLLPYLSGVIRNLVIADARELGLLGDESPAEIVRAICEAKTERNKITKIAWAKFCLEHKVRVDLAQRCAREAFDAIYRRAHRVADYFFERFVPDQCTEIARKRRDILNELISSFLSDSTRVAVAVEYVGSITPYARWSAGGTAEGEESSEYESEFQRFLEEEGS